MMVWRIPHEGFSPKCAIPTAKHDGGSVMVWGCFIRRGVEALCIMDRFYYRDILEQSLQPSISHFKLGQWYIFMDDNGPKLTSGLVKDCLKRKRIETLPWPPYSPDLNPIENLWNELERRVKKRQLKNITEPKLRLIQEWNTIELPALEKFVDSVPSRLYECIKMQGYPTKY